MAKTLFEKALLDPKDTHYVTNEGAQEVIKVAKNLFRNKVGLSNFAPTLQIELTDKHLILKHKKNFWVFCENGSRLYECCSDVSLSDFSSRINVDAMNSTNNIDLCMFIKDFIDETDSKVEYVSSSLTQTLMSK
jgi:hypothetical protein